MKAAAEVLAALPDDEQRAWVAEARAECWRQGDLTYLLHDGWREIWADMQARPEETRWVLEISRKWGKTFFLVFIAATLALRHRNSRIVYGAPTFKHLQEFVLPVLDEIAADAPPELRPRYEPTSGHWYFPGSGSWVHFFGADDKHKANRGRGPKCIAWMFDEAGFTPVLRYVISSVFRPSMLKGGLFGILSSTPSDEPNHDFTLECDVAEANGTLVHRDLFSNPLLSPEQITKFVEDDARDNGMSVDEYRASSTFQREYMAKRIADATLIVMGDDWERAKPTSLEEFERPQFFDAYEVLDMGGTDPRGVLFGFYDFANNRLCIEDEINLRNNENTLQLADAIKAKETALYGAKSWDGTLRAIQEERADDSVLSFLPEKERARIRRAESQPLQPYLRVCDHDTQIAIDLSVLHGLTFLPAEKTALVLVVNDFRVALRQGRIRIHPRCRDLERQLRTTLWKNERAIDLQRKHGEHGDLLWCAVYMWRNVRRQRNPVPPNYGRDPANQVVRPTPSSASLRGLVGPRRR